MEFVIFRTIKFMRTLNKFTLVLFIIFVVGRAALAQQDDVVRITTELVQTGVTVLDKQGRLVDGLKKDDFELRVDGRVVPISFFENIVAGSQRDRAARVPGKGPAPVKQSPAEVSFRQRTIIFFLDDRHLSLGSLGRTRKTLSDFIDKEMGQNDLVAIASTSGQIGFLQQFTDNKDVLRAAVARLNHVPYVITDYGGNPGSRMTENMALTIERKDDSNVFDFFVGDCLRAAPKGVQRQDRAAIRRHCEIEVQNRARQIVLQAGTVTAGTYYSLETLLRSAERMPGSKLAFFFSDGFLSDSGPRGPIAGNQIGRLTDQARRAGVVIYSIDARGLTSGALDAAGDVPFDPDGRLQAANAREIAASQDALNALAVDTGGRALRNQNTFDLFINEAVAETSRYYLIAWRPEGAEEKTENYKKIQITVVGRPELTVNAARGFFSNPASVVAKVTPPSEEDKKPAKQESKADADLREALNDSHSSHALPLQLSLIYLDTPANGSVLTTSLQAPTDVLSYGNEGREPAQLNVAGVVLNDQGKRVAGFKTELKVNPASASHGDQGQNVIYNYRSPLKPGIYQVRVAARDDRSGTVGSAHEWIVIPDLSTRQLSLSSLILGLGSVTHRNAEAGQIQWSVDKRFAKNSQFEFMTFIYNGSNNLAAQVQVYKDGKSVLIVPTKNIEIAKEDPHRTPFKTRIDLAGLQPGRYTLEVNVEDRASQKRASQQTTFYIYEN